MQVMKPFVSDIKARNETLEDYRKRQVQEPIQVESEEEARNLLMTIPYALMGEVMAVVGEAQWETLSEGARLGRVLNFMARMNNQEALLYGQVSDAQEVMTLETDAEPLSIAERPLGEMLKEVVKLAARVGDERQTIGILGGIEDQKARRQAAQEALFQAAENQKDGLIQSLITRDVKSRGSVRTARTATVGSFRSTTARTTSTAQSQHQQEPPQVDLWSSEPEDDGSELDTNFTGKEKGPPRVLPTAKMPEAATKQIEHRRGRGIATPPPLPASQRLKRRLSKEGKANGVTLEVQEGESLRISSPHSRGSQIPFSQQSKRSIRRSAISSRTGMPASPQSPLLTRRSAAGSRKNSPLSRSNTPGGRHKTSSRMQSAPKPQTAGSRGDGDGHADGSRLQTGVSSVESEAGDEKDYHLPSGTMKRVRDMIKMGNEDSQILEILGSMGLKDIAGMVLADAKEEVEGEALLANLPSSHPVKHFFSRLLGRSLFMVAGQWVAIYKKRRQIRESLQTQYVECCAGYRMTPICVQALRRLNFSAAADTLALPRQGLTKLALKALLEAISGTGPHLDPDGSYDLNWVRKELGDAPITCVDLSYNDIQVDGVNMLLESFLKNKWVIQELRIDYCNIRDQCAQAFEPILMPEYGSPYHHLTNISLAKNQIGDRGVAKFVQLLYDNRVLKSLNLSDNGAELYSGKALKVLLSENNYLEHLDLSFNRLRMEGAGAVAEGLKKNMQLQTLNVSWNGFGDSQAVLAISEAMPTCGLKLLDMSHNRVDRFGALLIAGPLSSNTTLERFIVDGNLISQVGARALYKAAKVASEGEDFTMEISCKDCSIGIVDQQGFDPTEPTGDYDLDMKDVFSRSVLISLLRIYMVGKGEFNKLKNDNGGRNAMYEGKPYKITLPTVTFLDKSGQSKTIINPDEGDWVVPDHGVLAFSFTSTRTRDEVDDALDIHSYDRLVEVFLDKESVHGQRKEMIDVAIAQDTCITFKQSTALLGMLTDGTNPFRENQFKQTRAYFVSTCYHKLVETHRVRELMDLLDPESRVQCEKLLGKPSFQFTRNNATGAYNLDLAQPASREIATRLLEIRNEQIGRVQQLETYTNHRRGRREEVQRVWRNARLDGVDLPNNPAWSLPRSGTLEVDFVVVKKPMGGSVMGTWDFEDLLDAYKEGSMEEEQLIRHLRKVSDEVLFLVEQVIRVLSILKKPRLRTEMVVIAWARTLDWHRLKHVYEYMFPNEIQMLRDRIGWANLFDETFAVGFYELNLRDVEQRWVAQELVHLSCEEPGENMRECTFNNADFEIPYFWTESVPKEGLLTMCYCRSEEVMKRVRTQGAWEHTESPMVKQGGRYFPESAWGSFSPKWLKVHEKDMHQAPNDGWLRESKFRRIREKLAEKFRGPRHCMDVLNQSKSGVLDRREVAVGLFKMAIWLHPSELTAFMGVLDRNRDRSVGRDEIEFFWSKYAPDDINKNHRFAKDEERPEDRLKSNVIEIFGHDDDDDADAAAGGVPGEQGDDAKKVSFEGALDEVPEEEDGGEGGDAAVGIEFDPNSAEWAADIAARGEFDFAVVEVVPEEKMGGGEGTQYALPEHHGHGIYVRENLMDMAAGQILTGRRASVQILGSPFALSPETLEDIAEGGDHEGRYHDGLAEGNHFFGESLGRTASDGDDSGSSDNEIEHLI